MYTETAAVVRCMDMLKQVPLSISKAAGSSTFSKHVCCCAAEMSRMEL